MRSLFGSAFFHVFVVIVVVAVDAATAAVVSSFIYSPVCMSVHVALALYTTPFIHTPYVLHVYYTYSLTCLLAPSHSRFSFSRCAQKYSLCVLVLSRSDCVYSMLKCSM